MVRKQVAYEQALRLRERGFTLEEIAKVCEISKSTASKWLKDEVFSAHVTKQNNRRAGQENAKRLRLVAKARGTERKKRYADAAANAKVEFTHYQSDPVFLAGLSAYVAAGDVRDERSIRFSHAEPELHRLFIRFARQYLGVPPEAVHLWLQLYQGVSEERAMKHWAKATRLPYRQFYKNHYVTTKAKQPLHFGVGNTIIASTYHKQKLKTWVSLAKKAW
jgi:transcriptional regulator with XRE-family HTH domain